MGFFPTILVEMKRYALLITILANYPILAKAITQDLPDGVEYRSLQTSSSQ